MEVNSRGRAALRDAHGMRVRGVRPCKGQTDGRRTLSYSSNRALRAKPLVHGY